MPYYIINLYNLFISYRKQVLYGMVYQRESKTDFQNDPTENEAEYRQLLEKQLFDKRRLSNKTDYCQGKASGGEIDENMSYMLFKKDDSFYIVYDIDAELKKSDSLETLKKLAGGFSIVIKESEYYIELLDNEQICNANRNYYGEVTITVNDIGILFKPLDGSRNEYRFYAINNPSNISRMSALFKNLHFKNFYNIIDLPEEVITLTVNKGNGFLANNVSYAAFRKDGFLVLLRPETTNPYIVYASEIAIDEIRYYRQEGSLYYEQSLSGTGGGSNSYGGAIVGGILFGAAGAIIGSRKNDTPVNITTTTTKHDSRIVVLNLQRNGHSYNVSLSPSTEDALDWLIPEKQYDYVISKRRQYFEEESKRLALEMDNDTLIRKPFFPLTRSEKPTGIEEKSSPSSAIPVIHPDGTINCPVCGQKQFADREKCFKCGIVFTFH